jgi:hypothetical protein
MSGKRQNNQPEQLGLAFPAGSRGEAPMATGQGTEPSTAKRVHESPADTERLMEEVCGRDNCLQALRRVKANKGSPGVDGRCFRFCRGAGTGRSLITATGFDPDARRIRR